MSTWCRLAASQNYLPYTSSRILVVTATNDAHSPGATGVIKSFFLNSKLIADFLVLAKDLRASNRKMLSKLPRTTVYDLRTHNAPDHPITWILELFYQVDLQNYDYIFYVDTDIMVRKELVTFVHAFSSYEDDVCVIDHKKSWHTEWFHKCNHNFNSGFIVFKNSFFGSDTHQKLKSGIQRDQPKNDEKYLRSFFNNQDLLYAPTKYNARIIWLNREALKNDDIYVIHFIGQENKPWLKNQTRWESEWHKIFNW